MELLRKIAEMRYPVFIENHIDGIKYISTNIYVPIEARIRRRFINYAFPAKGDDTKLINYFLTSSVINAASCQGITQLRKDVQGISKFLNDLNRDYRRGTSRLPPVYGVEMMPYSGGTDGFAYWDSVFGEIEAILMKELRVVTY